MFRKRRGSASVMGAWHVLIAVCGAEMLSGCAGHEPPEAAPAAGTDRGVLVTQARVFYAKPSSAGEQIEEDARTGAADAAAELGYGPPGEFLGKSRAAAGFARLEASAFAAGKEIVFDVQAAHAEAAASDTLTLAGGSGAATVYYTLALSGASSGPGRAGACLFFRHGSDPDEELTEGATVSGSFTTTGHAVRYGEPFAIRTVLLTDASLERGRPGESAARFSASLVKVTVVPSGGTMAGRVALRSASGTAYAVEPR